MQIPSKVRLFAWRLTHNSIPTEMVRYSRNLSTTTCKICGATEDSWSHALLHCIMSRCVWALMDEDITDLIAAVTIYDPKDWGFFFMMNNLDNNMFIKLLVACWAIWHARRNAINEDNFQSPLSTYSFIQSYIE